ncbi:MAG: OsmC family protein [Rhodothermales bacterium]|nr:OsmC family protein [Rhodothermales bacterium]
MKRKGSAVWTGSIKEGSGTVSTESGVLSTVNYSFSKRFGDEPGTNPEELIAAAHAGCYAMALSGELGRGAGLTAERLSVSATVSLERIESGFAITAVHLDLSAKVPGASEEAFLAAADTAKVNCPVSKVLNAKVTLDAQLES